MRELTAERARDLLSYCPETGAMTWNVRRKGVRVGGVAGHLHKAGYRRIRIDYQIYLAHRLAWLITHGSWPSDQIDHINGVRHDNRLANLREATNTENQQNQRKAMVDNKSGFLGVREQHGKFSAQIKVNGRYHHIGRFATAEEAHSAYRARKRELHPFSTLGELA